MCTKKITQWINELLALSIQPMVEEFRVNLSRFFQYKEQRHQREVKYTYLNYYIPLLQEKFHFLIHFPFSLCRIL